MVSGVTGENLTCPERLRRRFLKNYLTQRSQFKYIRQFQIFPLIGGVVMVKSPCITCDRANEDKNKCLDKCDRLKEYQEMILKQGIYATM